MTEHLLRSEAPWALIHNLMPPEASAGRAIVGHCLRLGCAAHNANEISEWFGWDRKAIYRKLKSEHLPSIREVIELGRLLHVAIGLDTTSFPIATLARQLHFDGASSLCRLCKRRTALTPSALRERGAVDIVVASLRAMLYTNR